MFKNKREIKPLIQSQSEVNRINKENQELFDKQKAEIKRLTDNIESWRYEYDQLEERYMNLHSEVEELNRTIKQQKATIKALSELL